jgi:hypothetical protein
MDYEKKYIKYKNKYLKFKKSLYGGSIDTTEKDTTTYNIRIEKLFEIIKISADTKFDHLKKYDSVLKLYKYIQELLKKKFVTEDEYKLLYVIYYGDLSKFLVPYNYKYIEKEIYHLDSDTLINSSIEIYKNDEIPTDIPTDITTSNTIKYKNNDSKLYDLQIKAISEYSFILNDDEIYNIRLDNFIKSKKTSFPTKNDLHNYIKILRMKDILTEDEYKILYIVHYKRLKIYITSYKYIEKESSYYEDNTPSLKEIEIYKTDVSIPENTTNGKVVIKYTCVSNGLTNLENKAFKEYQSILEEQQI